MGSDRSPPAGLKPGLSLRLRIAKAGMRWVMRPILARQVSTSLLRRIALLGIPFQMPRRDVATARWDGPRGGLVLTPQGAARAPVLLWMHGGAYVACSPRTHRGMVAEIARAARVSAILPEYRLAPEASGGAAFDDGLAAAHHLLAGGLAPGQLILGGDSAGGGLAAAVTAALCAEGRPPAALIALSPWTDLSGSGASLATHAAQDSILPAHRLQETVDLVRGPLPADDPRLSPAFASFPGLARAYVSVGDEEILQSDAEMLVTRLCEAGAEVQAPILPGQPHVVALLAPFVPEARAEVRRIARFIKTLHAMDGIDADSR